MALSLSQFTQNNPLGDSRLFGLAVLLPLPALLFSNLVSPWAPLVAIGCLLLLVGLRLAATGQALSHKGVDLGLVGLLLLLPLGLVVSAEPAVTLPRTYAFVANVAFFWAVAAQRDNPWLRYSSWLLLLGGLGLGLAMLLGTNFASNKLPFIDRALYELLPGGWRPFWNDQGFNSNLTGGMVALFWPPIFVLIWGGYTWQQRDLAKPVLLVLSLLLLLAQSRGALLGVLLALPIITLLHSRRWWLAWLAGLALLGAGLTYYGPGAALTALLGPSEVLGQNSLAGRRELWSLALELIRRYPLTGVGFGMFEPMVFTIAPPPLANLSEGFKHTHNIYLQAGVDQGLIGLVGQGLIFGLLGLLLWRRATQRRAGFYRLLALGLLGSLIVFLTHGFFEVITYAPRAAIVVWGLLGLMAAVATRPLAAPHPPKKATVGQPAAVTGEVEHAA